MHRPGCPWKPGKVKEIEPAHYIPGRHDCNRNARNAGVPRIALRDFRVYTRRATRKDCSMDALLNREALFSLLTLSLMEIVLGIDNIVFISILVGKLPIAQQKQARRLGLTLALVIRLGLLGAIKWIMGLTAPLFTIFSKDFTGQKLILLGGGLFLVGKSTHEIYEKLEGEEAHGA